MDGLNQLEAALRLAIAALVGIGVGLEREWSGHAAGPDARFAGLRTFLLLGMLGGVAGLLAAAGAGAGAAVLASGGVLLAVAAYVMAVRRPGAELDGTTEAAAVVVVAIGVTAGLGWLGLAAGAGSVVVLVLSEKTRLHWLVGRVGDKELRAALQFAVLALVVLPLLPAGPYGGVLDIRPRALWTAVLLFSGLNYAGYIARRAVGTGHGDGVTGLLGGIVSSTVVTLQFSRQSRDHPERAASLATGAVAASVVLLPRIAVVSAALNPEVAAALALRLVPAFLAGAAATVLLWRGPMPHGDPAAAADESPLKLWSAIRLALAFQAAIILVELVGGAWGTSGLYATAGLLGLSDVDALTVAMSRADAGLAAGLASRAIVVGVIANTAVKLAMSLALGSPAFRRRTGTGLATLGAALALGAWFL